MYPSSKPTIVHSNIVGVCAISGHTIAKKYGLKHVITEHWTRVDKYMRNNKLSFLGRKAYNGADHITVVSSFLGNVVKKYVKDPSKITRVANVIDPETFHFAPKTPSPNKVVFCSIGHLKLPKLPLLMVKGLQILAQKNEKQIEFYMFGKGPQQKEIEELMPSLGYKLHLMGLWPKSELADTLRKSDFYLHASSYETFCVAIAEALCTGTPVIASNNTAIPELIHDSNGLLTQDMVEEWAKAILKALEIPFDHKKIAQETEAKYTYLSIGEAFNRVYASCYP
jgi:glycosyltransferase involved in cell wall biosynthesis